MAVAAIKATHGVTYQYGPSAQTIYVASGSAPDWTYGAMNVTWSYVVELRDTGTRGAHTEIDSTNNHDDHHVLQVGTGSFFRQAR